MTYFPNTATNIIPGIDDGYDLGSPSRRWQDGYLSDSLFVGSNFAVIDATIGTASDGYVLSVAGGQATWRSVDLVFGSADSLTLNLAENCYKEYIYSGQQVTDIIVWETAAKLKRIRDYAYVYVGPNITTETVKQYNSAGVEIQRLIKTYTFSGSNVVDVTIVESP